MHVRLAAPRGALVSLSLVSLASLSLLACDARPDPTKKSAPPVLSHPSAAPDASVDPALLPLARAARDAAMKLVSGCQLRAQYGDDFMRYSDGCTFAAADVAALRSAEAALAAAPAPANREAAIFAENARLFTAWIDLVKDGEKTGTLAHYQDLAAAWNALQPSDRIPVDLRTKDPYAGTVLVKDGGAPLVWGHCSTGPCVILPRKGH